MEKTTKSPKKVSKSTKTTKKVDLKGGTSPETSCMKNISNKPAKTSQKRTCEVEISKKGTLNLKIDRINKRKEKAIQLKRDLDKITVEHDKFITIAEKLEGKQKILEESKEFKNFFMRENLRYDDAENKAYKKYYEHMHKDFDVKNSKVNFTNFKEGFVDEKFIKEIYKDKIKTTKAEVKHDAKSKR